MADSRKQSEPKDRLTVTLVSENSCQVACLKRDLVDKRLRADLTLQRPMHSTAASLRRLEPGPDQSHLVILDFTQDTQAARRMLTSVAFGEKRCRAIVAILTRPDTEALLLSGDVDGGTATMFSATALCSVLDKLGGSNTTRMLHSLGVLNQFGPVLLAVPQDYVREDSSKASA